MIKLLTRISTSLVAGVDKTVAQIENHDALVDASLKQTRRAAAQAKVRLARLERDRCSLQSRISDHENQIQQWEARAYALRDSDRERALQCIQRRKQIAADLEADQQTLEQHIVVENNLRQNVLNIEQRLDAVARQRNQLRTRESAAQAQSIINDLDRAGSLSASSDLQDIFDRWDERVAENEIVMGMDSQPGDPLTDEFVKEELRLELERDLDVLVAPENDDLQNKSNKGVTQ